jgi:hypothetical protein
VAARTKTLDTKKLQIALQAIEHKVTQGGVLRVGFLEDAKYPAKAPSKKFSGKASPGPKSAPPLSVAQVAFWNEFGTRRAPSRPFFRTTIAQESKKWGDHLGMALKHYNDNGELALRAVGQEMRDDVEAQIQRWTTPGNAPYTIRRKGFDKPLVHTSVMVRAPDFEIVKQ